MIFALFAGFAILGFGAGCLLACAGVTEGMFIAGIAAVVGMISLIGLVITTERRR